MVTRPPSGDCRLDPSALRAAVEGWASGGLRVVLTNGCFDLLHVGHVRYLTAARSLGDVLVVAVNDDDSTRALKGAGRPLLPLEQRTELLCALRAIDAVVPFGGRTAVPVVEAIRPAVYVKGGDYGSPERWPPEADAAAALGAEVVFLAYTPGLSTTALLARLREA